MIVLLLSHLRDEKRENYIHFVLAWFHAESTRIGCCYRDISITMRKIRGSDIGGHQSHGMVKSFTCGQYSVSTVSACRVSALSQMNRGIAGMKLAIGPAHHENLR